MSHSANATNECPICLEEYNLNIHTRVKCEYCPMEACRSCCTRYILGETTIKCMDTNCGRTWTTKHISSSFTKSFVKSRLRQHIENILFEKERQTFPEAIDKITLLEDIKEDFKCILSILKKNCINKNQFINEDSKRYNQIQTISNILFERIQKGIIIEKTINDICNLFIDHDEIDKINSIISSHIFCKNVEKLKHIDKNRIYVIFNVIYYILCGEKNEQKKATTKCYTPSCNGFLDHKLYCILCKKTTCSSCLEENKKGHECNPDTVETVKLIKTDTKSCPKCNTNIYKIDGCDQMWCTKCRTGFSWETGKIETKLHNPHYYEWMRANANNVGANPNNCETEIDLFRAAEEIDLLQPCINDCINKYGYHKDCIQKYYFKSKMYEINSLRRELQLYNNNVRFEFTYSFILKLNYLNKKISEREYKRFLENKENDKNRNIEISQLIQMWIVVQSDIFKRIINSVKNEDYYKNKQTYNCYNEELKEFQLIIKKSINVIENAYNTTLDII